MLKYLQLNGKRPAVIMNEIGDVNLDGLLINDEVLVAEMLNGCICCTMREDLSSTLLNLYRRVKPDIIIIESTGIANPLELKLSPQVYNNNNGHDFATWHRENYGGRPSNNCIQLKESIMEVHDLVIKPTTVKGKPERVFKEN
ncbi:hypothetical protein M3226_28460 [Neobacillus cucumis]|nr:hypothetical protein [Neobacillus cucumis]